MEKQVSSIEQVKELVELGVIDENVYRMMICLKKCADLRSYVIDSMEIINNNFGFDIDNDLANSILTVQEELLEIQRKVLESSIYPD